MTKAEARAEAERILHIGVHAQSQTKASKEHMRAVAPFVHGVANALMVAYARGRSDGDDRDWRGKP